MSKIKNLYFRSGWYSVYNLSSVGGKARTSLLAATIAQAVVAGFSGGIPVTMLLVAALYFGQQVYDIIFVHDNVANFMHIVGGLCGTAFGYYCALHRRPARSRR